MAEFEATAVAENISAKLDADQIDEYSKYLLHSRPEIVAVLRSLVKKRAMLSVHFDNGDSFLLTTLLAVDGSVAAGVARQLPGVPADATHLFVSVGGNDALGEMRILQMPAASGVDVFNELANVAAAFEERYERMLGAVRELGKPTAVCTIYYPRYPDADAVP